LSTPATSLFTRLKFADCHALLIHSVESVLPDGSFPGIESTHALVTMIDEMEEAGKKALHDAAASMSDCATEERMVQGDPLRNMLDLAETSHFDLMVVGSQNRSSLEKVLLGSVTRGLLNKSVHSFLVGKAYGSAAGPVTAVFATDHSDYCDRCAELLMELKPQGISRLVVLTVFDSDAPSVELEESTRRVAEQLRGVAPTLSKVVEGDVDDGIAQTMVDESADLLIIGGQGHGFLERLRSGSTSWDQVEKRDYSVLVLRP
jgi:nucleotide-binding universal stress UspA family protein